MSKLIRNTNEVSEKINNALNLITEPVVQTLGPLGRNVIYEGSDGHIYLTNDGVTIAKQVESDDPIENAVIEMVKTGALQTNEVAGDGTTTTTLFTSILTKEGRKMISDGMNPIHVKEYLEELGESLVSRIKPITVDNEEQLLSIATVSANNDKKVAEDVVDIVNTVGNNGLVVLDVSHSGETILDKSNGFVLYSGLYGPEYASNGGVNTTVENPLVFVTDKRIYYPDEAKAIIRAAVQNKVENLVVVARDFIGKAVEVFSYNQLNNQDINLTLIKATGATEKDNTVLDDLATYLDGNVYSEKNGKITDLKLEDFCTATKVFADRGRAVLTTDKPASDKLKERIKFLESEKESNPDDSELEKRLASLTSGMVTVKVGGATQVEIRERLFRYEDAINAARAANKYGYLPGGGLSMLSLYEEGMDPICKKICEASIRQIAKNAGEHEDTVIRGCQPDKGIGYNAKTKEFVNMVESGIIDPYKVTEMAIKNSVSIAISILTAGFMIVNEKENKDE